mmetsp:Transcript_87806/g.188368  ORF Transcript_87806/g.188368 Transcript_87806/m.188368 type:complete len:201 (+) Transcript_87806:507-1109(+)
MHVELNELHGRLEDIQSQLGDSSHHPKVPLKHARELHSGGADHGTAVGVRKHRRANLPRGQALVVVDPMLQECVLIDLIRALGQLEFAGVASSAVLLLLQQGRSWRHQGFRLVVPEWVALGGAQLGHRCLPCGAALWPGQQRSQPLRADQAIAARHGQALPTILLYIGQLEVRPSADMQRLKVIVRLGLQRVADRSRPLA